MHVKMQPELVIGISRPSSNFLQSQLRQLQSYINFGDLKIYEIKYNISLNDVHT